MVDGTGRLGDWWEQTETPSLERRLEEDEVLASVGRRDARKSKHRKSKSKWVTAR